MLENVTYTHKQSRIDTLTLENIIYIGSIAMKLFCKPCCRSSLLMKHLLYDTPDINHKKTLPSVGFVRMLFIQKSVKPTTCCSLHSVRLSHCPVCRNEQRESLKPICIYPPCIIRVVTTNIKEYEKHTHETFTVALFLTDIVNLRDSTESKPKRQVNAFSIMSSPPIHLNSYK